MPQYFRERAGEFESVPHLFNGGHIMFTSKTNRLALAFTCLSAIALCGAAVSAQAATVVSTAQYQKRIPLSCSGLTCNGNIPAVAAKHRLNITRLTCLLNTTSGSTFSAGALKLRDASNTILFEEYVAVVHSSANGDALSVNQAVDMQAAARQSMAVQMNFGNGSVGGADCVATGTLDTLQ